MALLTLCVAAAAALGQPAAATVNLPIPLKTGNLSVDFIIAAANGLSPPALPNYDELDAWRAAGVDSVEDYQCWLPLEPERDRWEWAPYEHAASELERRGMGYAVYPWLHFAPRWAMQSELWDPLVRLGGGEVTFAPSIWSPATEQLFDRYYRALAERMGDRVRAVYVSLVTDFGEVGYPVGMADSIVHAPYVGPGFWCGDVHARADFRIKMLALAGGLEALNRRWGTNFVTAEAIDYPAETATEGPDPVATAALPAAERGQVRRRWLDFASWYIGSMADFANRAVAISRRYYPTTPHEVKIGFASERVRLGVDYSASVTLAAQAGYTVRSTHGKLPLFFYRRFASAAKKYGAPLVTEPPSAVSRDEEVERIFKDATSGSTEYFDYPANILAATDLFARYGRYLEGQHSLTEVAFFYPTTDHRLQPGQDNPPRLLEACAASRELFDWDLLDEGLIRSGALNRYRALLWPEGQVVEADVLRTLQAWVEGGGWLLAAPGGPVESVEGEPAGWLAPPADPPAWDELMPATGSPLPAMRVDIGGGSDGPLLVGNWSFAESGHWEWGGEPEAIRKRWTSGRAGVLLPVDPAATYELAIEVALHPKRLAEAGTVLVNGTPVGKLEPVRTQVFRTKLTPALLKGRATVEVLLDTATWRPSEIDASADQRTLGLAVRSFKLWRADQPEPATAATPQLARRLDRQRLAPGVRRVGRGGVLHAPADLPNMAALCDLAAAVLSGPHLLPQRVVPDFGAGRDGVWVALLPNRVLLYNGANEPRTRELVLDPALLQRLGAQAPAAARTVSVRLSPVSLASIELPSGEVLLP